MKVSKVMSCIVCFLTGTLVAYLLLGAAEKTHGESETLFCYSDGEMELTAEYSDNVAGYCYGTVVHVTKGDFEKVYIWPQGEGVKPEVSVSKLDLTGNGTEEYAIKYCLGTGTGSATYFMSILNGQSLDVVTELGDTCLFTEEQLEALNRLMDKEKEKEPEKLKHWETCTDGSFMIFEPTLAEHNGKNGIIVRVVNWYDHNKGYEIEVFLTYQAFSRTFVVEELVGIDFI